VRCNATFWLPEVTKKTTHLIRAGVVVLQCFALTCMISKCRWGLHCNFVLVNCAPVAVAAAVASAALNASLKWSLS